MAAKLAQAARMLAASACCSVSRVPGIGALGWSKMYWSSYEWVAAGGSGANRSGALSSLNWYAKVGTR